MVRRPSAKNEMQDPSLPQKQRARWRFIGASILALFAMVLLPLALESEPRQALGGIDVSIPKREDLGRRAQYWPDTSYRQAVVRADQGEQTGLFTRSDAQASQLDDNRFNPSGRAARPSDSKAPVSKSLAPAQLADRSVKPISTNKKSKNGSGSAAKAAPSKLAIAKPTVNAAPKIKQAKVQPAPKAPPMPERRTDRNKIKAASPSGYVVQIGAFSSRKGARAQVKRAKGLGFKAYTERISTKKGDRIRVRIGPYLNRAQANTAREKLRKKGVETALIAP